MQPVIDYSIYRTPSGRFELHIIISARLLRIWWLNFNFRNSIFHFCFILIDLAENCFTAILLFSGHGCVVKISKLKIADPNYYYYYYYYLISSSIYEILFHAKLNDIDNFTLSFRVSRSSFTLFSTPSKILLFQFSCNRH